METGDLIGCIVTLVVLELTHMVVKCQDCLVKVTSLCDVAYHHIQGLQGLSLK